MIVTKHAYILIVLYYLYSTNFINHIFKINLILILKQTFCLLRHLFKNKLILYYCYY